MLCDEEGDASFSQTFCILLHHIISHDLNIPSVGLQQEVTHDMSLRGQGDAMVCIRIGGKVFLQHLHELSAGTIEWQVEHIDLDAWEMVVHIVAEPNFTVVLLLADHDSVLCLSHQHNLLFFESKHHEHLGSEKTTAERILSEEGKWAEIRHVGVEQDERNVQLMQLVGKRSGYFKR